MKIVNIIGGLGNQMFQYAFALALKQRWPEEEVLIDTSHYRYVLVKKCGASNLHNGYEMEAVFPKAKLPIASAKQLKRVTRYIPNYLLSRVARRILPIKQTEIIQPTKDSFAYNPSVLEQEGSYYYEGIWESVHYLNPIRSIIQDVYSHSVPNDENSAYIHLMENEESVGVHIRRGDYLYSESFRDICDKDYYNKAIEAILADGNEHHFYVFSNDIEWCNNNIKPLVGANPITMVTHNTGKNSCWDMFLMTHCKDLIIANSSFSWWGAFLNSRDGRVVAPKKWVNRNAEFDIWLPEWTRI